MTIRHPRFAPVFVGFFFFAFQAFAQSKPASAPAPWTDAKSGITLNLPPQFEVFEDNNSVQLRAEPRENGGFNCVIVIKVSPNPTSSNAATLLSLNFESMKKTSKVCESGELRLLDGRAVARIQSREEFNNIKMRAATLVAPVPGQTIVVSSIITEDRFAALNKTVEAMLSSIKFGKRDDPKEVVNTRIEGSKWILPECKVSVPIPLGWNVMEQGGKAFLYGNRSAFGDNVNVLMLDNAKKMGAAELLKVNEEQVGKDAIYKSEVRTIGGEKAAYLCWKLVQGKNNLRMVSLVFPRGDQQLAVTITTLDSRWKENEPVVESIVKGLAFTKN